jgi:ribosomal protein S18 acetylase RimI-like enzyme
MIIRNACKRDFSAIAKLHVESIKTGFLSKLGIPFLVELYKAIQKQDGSCVLVAETDNRIYGFIAGTTNISNLYKRVLLNNWYRLLIPGLRFVINFKFYSLFFETIFYGLKKEEYETEDLCSSELLSIAVDENIRGKGIGKALVDELEKFFILNSISKYRVVTFSKDPKANSFYRSCQFSIESQFIHHGNVMNKYTKQIVV